MAAQREWFEKDYYAVLGVADSASAKEIKSAYRKLSRQFHPDANAGDASAEERFKEISAAYDVLGDEAKRKEYDEVRRLGPMGNPFGGGGGPGGFRFTDGGGDLGDLFGGLFTRGRARTRGAGRPPGSTGPQRGADLESELQLSFEGAASGVETTVNLTSDVACSTCHGSGAKPGTTPRVCPVCEGRGVTSEDQGFFSFSAPCQNCRGQGYLVDDPCPTCRGTGAERRARQVKVRIPAGVKAVAANITVVSPTGAGHLSLYPSGTTPGTSTVNFRAGQTRACNSVLALNNGAVDAQAAVTGNGSVQVLIDVSGYFQ
jgi:molecular chaperone DnaJ